MKFPRLAGRRRSVLIGMTLVTATATAVTMTTLAGAEAQKQNGGTKLYIVQTAGAPAATYAGGVSGIPATKPASGATLDARNPSVKTYRGHLSAKHNETLGRAGISTTKRAADYGLTFNGFAARLTEAEAKRLEHTEGVTRVWANEVLTADTISTPDFLGLSGRNGVWDEEFNSPKKAGEGVIVGVIDTGFWPENPSFAALKEPRPDAATIAAKWHGTCDTGANNFVACNNKVIGARYYNQTGLAQPYEFLSPRDYNGHGSHTASTAAGNYKVAASINGDSVGNTSGMAPGARISVYKTLWHNQATGSASGGTADLVAAIEDAVADGVDVISYSISGSSQYVVTPDEIAFFNAAAAGVFVSASAGNSGPAASTVAHNSPWVTTVAASTHDRSVAKTVTLGNGATYNGVGVGAAVASTSVIDSTAAGLPGAAANAVQACFSDADSDPSNGAQPVLDPAKIAGKIVLCQRGITARTDKSLAVTNGGGVGMILYNSSANSLNADFHTVPTIHVDEVAAAAIREYAATAGATAAISAILPGTPRAPEMAGFSSAGPALAGGGDLLKPDITAPGVDVIAAVAPPGNNGKNFDALSGTSMSAPHISGIAAMVMSAHPNWTPMQVKSALMTSATPKDNSGQPIQRAGVDATPLDYGSGHVVPANAFNPGLVYDSTPTDWIKYGCSINQFQLVFDPALCASAGPSDPSDLNYPSISIGDLPGSQTVTRTVTNLDKKSTYRVSVQAPAGFTVAVSPTKLTLAKGAKGTFTVTITRTTAAIGSWSFGSLTWKGGNHHTVRSPIAVRPVAFAAPTEVSLSGVSGSSDVNAKVGFTGTLTTSVAGLVGASVTSHNLDSAGPGFSSSNPMESTATAKVTVDVPAGTKVARFATFDEDYAMGTDIDIFVYRVSGTSRVLVGQSAGGTSDETVTLNSPAAATYEFYVNLFASAPGGATTATITPDTWVIGDAAAGNLTATPASQSVTTGQAATVGLNWTGLTAGLRYLGVVSFSDGTATVGRTFVGVKG